MANADTRDKRGSSIAILKVHVRLEQNPSGTIAQAGRQFAAYSYMGILASAPSQFLPEWAINSNQLLGPIAPQPETH